MCQQQKYANNMELQTLSDELVIAAKPLEEEKNNFKVFFTVVKLYAKKTKLSIMSQTANMQKKLCAHRG